MQDGAQNQGGMRDTRNIKGGIRDENILVGHRDALISVGGMRDSLI